ncbi:MAG: FtsQ-type POTRA domain-containing protein [Patescibacteria group bacterium]
MIHHQVQHDNHQKVVPHHEGSFVEAKPRVQTSRKKMTIFFLGIFAVIGWIYILFFSSIFTIQKFEIQGTKQLSRGEVEKAAKDILKQGRAWPIHEGNIFFLNTTDISKTLQDHLFAESVVVDKIYPNVLRLIVKERQSSLILVSGSSMFEIDRKGVATREITSSDERSAIMASTDHPSGSSPAEPILHISNAPDIMVSNEFVTPERMQGWLDTFQGLSKRGFGFRSAELDMASSTMLVLNMYEPYKVYFDLSSPLNQQLDSYYAFIRSHGSTGDIHEYVDARIPGRLFYK